VNADADSTPAAILARLERLEKALSGGGSIATPSVEAAAPAPAAATGPAVARAALGSLAHGKKTPSPAKAEAVPAPAAAPAAPSPASDSLPSRDELTVAWADAVVPKLKGMAKALFLPGRFVGETDGRVAFAVPNDAHRNRAEPYRADVETALAAHFGRPVPLELVLDEGQRSAPVERAAQADDERDEAIDPAELVDAGRQVPDNGLERLTRAFPGAEVIQEDA
jgi:hypothetical protein